MSTATSARTTSSGDHFLISQLADAIGQQVDPRLVLERICQHPDTIRALGNVLRCACPVHGEERSASLLVYLDKRQFKCMKPACGASRGGPLLEIYLMAKGLDGVGGLMAAAADLRVSIDLAIVGNCVRALRAEAESALVLGEMPRARSAAEQALMLDSADPEVLRFVAHLDEREGHAEKAGEGYLRAARAAYSRRMFERTVAMLRGDVLRLVPQHTSALNLLVDSLERAGRQEDADQLRLELVDQNTNAEDAGATLHQIYRRRQDPSIGLRAAETLLAGERLEEADRLLAELAPLLAKGTDRLAELRGIELSLGLRPLDADLRERQIAILRQLDEPQRSAEACAAWGEALRLAGQHADAEARIGEALALDPRCLSAREAWAALLGDMGFAAEQAKALHGNAAMYMELGRIEDAAQALRDAHAAVPESAEIAIALGDAEGAAGNWDAAMEAWRAAAALLQDVDGGDALLELAERFLARATDTRALAGAARLLAEGGQRERAAQLMADRAQAQLAADPADALFAAREAVTLGAGSVGTEALFEAALAAASASDALEALRRGAESTVLADEDPVAERTMRVAAAFPRDAATLEACMEALLSRARRAEAEELLRAAIAAADADLDNRIRLRRRLVQEFSPTPIDRADLAADLGAAGDTRGAEAALVEVADALEAAGDWENAILTLERAVVAPDASLNAVRRAADAQLAHGDVYRAHDLQDRLVEMAVATGEAPTIRSVFEHILRVDPTRRDTALRHAQWLAANGAGADALSVLTRLEPRARSASDRPALIDCLRLRVSLSALDYDAFRRLGAVLAEAGDLDGARDAYIAASTTADAQDELHAAMDALEELTTLLPEDRDILVRLAALHERANEMRKAAQRLLMSGELHLRDGRWSDAEAALERAISCDGTLAEARLRLAELLRQQGRAEEAAGIYEAVAALVRESGDLPRAADLVYEATQCDPKRRSAKVALAEDFANLGRMPAFRELLMEVAAAAEAEGDLAAAGDAYARLGTRFPDDVELVERGAALLAKSGKLAEACARLLEAAAARTKSDAEGNPPRLPEAIRLVRRALDLDADNLAAADELATLLVSVGENEEASALLAALLRETARRHDFEGFASAATTAAMLHDGDANGLIELLHGATAEHVPEYAGRVLLGRAKVHLLSGDEATAAALAEGAIDHAADSDALRIAAVSHRALGNRDRAASHFLAYARTLEPEEAAEVLAQARQLAPERRDTAHAIAGALEKAGLKAEASRAWREFAHLAAEHGERPAATEVLREYLEREPDDAPSRECYAEMLAAEGEAGLALAEYAALEYAAAATGPASDAERFAARAVELDPASPVLRQRLAERAFAARGAEARLLALEAMQAWQATDDPDGVEQGFRALLETDPAHTELGVAFARWLTHAGRVVEAVADLRRLADAAQAAGGISASLPILAEWRTLAPDSADASLLEARWREEANDAPGAAAAWLAVAAVHDQEGRADEAAAAIGEAARLAPYDVGVQLRKVRLGHGRPVEEQLLDWERLASKAQSRGRSDVELEAVRAIAQLAPNSISARARLAEVMERVGDEVAAAEEWTAAARMHLESGAPAEGLGCIGRAIMLQGDLVEVREVMFRIALALGEPERVRSAALELAKVLRAEGDFTRAHAALEQAFVAEPASPSLASAVVEEELRCGNRPGAAAAWTRHAEALAASSDFDGAVAALRTALELDDSRPERWLSLAEALEGQGEGAAATEAFLRVARHRMESGDRDGALELAARASRMAPDDPALRAGIFELLVSLGERQLAIQELVHAAEALVADDRTEDAIRLAREAMARVPDDPEAALALSRAYLAAKAASAYTETVLGAAKAFEGRGENARAEQALAEAIATLPEAPLSLHRALVDLIDRAENSRPGDLRSALEDLEVASQALGDRAAAREANRRILEIDPEDTDALQRLAVLSLEDTMWADALEHFLELGRIHEREGRHREASDAYRRSLELDNDGMDGLRGLMNCTRKLGDTAGFNDAANRLLKVYANASAVAEMVEVLGELAEVNPGDLALQEKLAESLNRLERWAELVPVLLRIAEATAAAGDSARAIAALEQVERLCPDDTKVLARLGDLHEAAGRKAQALHYLSVAAEKHEMMGELEPARLLCERLVVLDPDSVPIRTMRAVLFETLGMGEAAADEHAALARIHESRSQDSPAADAYAHLLVLAPLRIEAREKFAALLRRLKRDDEAATQFELIAFEREKSGRHREAAAAIRHAMEIRPDSVAVRTRNASILEALGHKAEAAREHLWLARHFRDDSSPETAIAHVDLALSLEPQDIEARMLAAVLQRDLGQTSESVATLVRLAAQAIREGNNDLAIEALEQARAASPEDAEIHRKLADLYMLQGRRDLALKSMLEIVRGNVEEGMIEEARTLAHSMYQEEPDHPGLRGDVAAIFLACGIPELAAQEYAELSRIHHSRGNTAEALAAAQAALAARPDDPSARRAAVDAFAAAGRADEAYATAVDLAQFHFERGRNEPAMDAVRAAVTLKPQDPEPRHMLCQCLQALSRTEELAKELRALGELHGQRGEHTQAAEAMKRLLRLRPDDTRARIQYIDQYRQVGDERDLVDDYLKLAELHARRGAVHEARRVYDRIKHLKPDHWEARSRYVEFLLGLDAEVEAIAEARSLADGLVKADRVREALSALAKVASAAENDPAYHQTLARAHMASNARGRAAKELRRAADLFRRMRDDDGYVAALQELAQADPMNTEVPAELVDHFEAKGDVVRAREASLVLAAGLRQRGLLDLAETELRRATRLAPGDLEAWRLLVECARETHDDREIVEDIVSWTRALVANGQVTEALSELRAAMSADPACLNARLLYVETYATIGSVQDIAEDVIALGDLLNQNGRPEEGVKWFGILLQGDPSNTDAKERLSATNAILKGERPAPAARPLTPPEQELDLSDTQYRRLQSAKPAGPQKIPGSGGPSSILANALSDIDSEDQRQALQQAVNMYRDILAVNAQNASVRIKLADVLEQAGDTEGSMRELVQASEILFNKGELNLCVSVCERILARNPRDQRVRDRLTKAVNKRDAFKAIESAILFSDREGHDQ